MYVHPALIRFGIIFFAAVNRIHAQDSVYLPVSRCMVFNAWSRFYSASSYYDVSWTHEGPAPAAFPPARRMLLPGTNHVHASGWRLTACRTGTSALLGPNFIPPLAYSDTIQTNWQANLQNTPDAKIESPFYPEGIGTLYFDAINVWQSEPTEITVEIATNMLEQTYLGGGVTNVMLPAESEQLVYNWQTLDVVALNAASSNDVTRYQRELLCRAPARFRIRRTGVVYLALLDNALTAIDNISASYPPADVVLERPALVFKPGYPAAGEPCVIRCEASCVGTNWNERTGYTNRAVTVHYRWRFLDQMSNAWASAPMSYVAGSGVGDGEVYEATLPAQAAAGDLEYFFGCEFEGYRYLHFDYTLSDYAYETEWLSPRMLREDLALSGGREYSVRLRPIASSFGEVLLVVGEPGAEHAVSMTPVEGGFWRGIVPLAGRDPTNLCFYVCGENRYDAVSDTFLPDPVYWGGASQTVPLTLPVTGVCGSGGVPPEHRIRVSTAGSGCVHVLFDDLTGAYRVTRAEYQDFNGWAAPPDVFTDSNGQVGKQKITQSFDGWTTNVTQRVTEYFAGYPAETNVFAASPSVTFNGWVRGSSAYAVDRLPADADNTPDPADPKLRNVAVALMGGESGLGLGYIHNQAGATLPDGLGGISFKSRLRQSANPFEAVYYKYGFAMQNYLVRVNVRAADPLPPESPSVSVLGYYSDPENFYEFRVTQIPDTAFPVRDKRIAFELYKWQSGIPYRLARSAPGVNLSLNVETKLEMRMYSVGSMTEIRCKFGTSDNVVSYSDSGQTGGPAMTQGGTIGFMSSDCRSGFSAVESQPTSSGAVPTGVATSLLSAVEPTFSSDVSNWSLAPSCRWEALATVTPRGIYAVEPTQTLGVYLQPTEWGTEGTPAAPGAAAWTLAHEILLTGFDDATHQIPVEAWRSHFVMLRVIGRPDGRRVDVVVDELGLSGWRGQTGSELSPGEDEQTNLPAAHEWTATEAWVSEGRVDLDHRRGGREVDALGAEGAWLDQSVRSPCMMTGAGMLEFDYQVLRAPARLTVQYAPAETPDAWQEVSSWVVAEAMTAFSHASVFLGTNSAGYLRVLNERDDACVDARVLIDHAVAWDEPPVDDTAWRAYNAKISDSDALRVMLDESKACFLNNSQTAETDPVQDRDLPFLQSPALAFPFGSLTFMARAYDAGMPATIAVYASTNGCAAPAEHWFKVHEFSGISHVLYQTYRFAPSLPAQFDAIRLVVATDGSSGRACVDDVAVCEPDAVAVAPCLIVQGPASPISERAALDGDGQVTVRLSEPYPEAVEVRLDVSPGASAANGCLSLTATNLVFEAGSVEQHVAINAVKDGTALSGAGGFTVTPVMVSPAAAQLYYSASFPAVVRVLNNAPLIVTPIDSGLQEPAMTIPCGQPFNFYWDVHDVSADSSADVGNGMMITWNFGDGSPSVVWGASGMISHVFASAGDWVVRMTACDKDGDADDVYFMVRVLEPATLLTPVPIPYAWLNLYPSALAAAGGDYESAAQDDTDSDGQATWQEYVAGSDPTNFYSVFRAGIVVSNGIGWITWAPDLGPFARRYTVEGKTNLTDEVWSERKSGMRFFKVKVSLPD